MFIKANKKKVRGKEYTNYLLVESVNTDKGPRHTVVCSLGNLGPAPAEHWHQLVRKVERALAGQLSLTADPQVEQLVAKVKERHSSVAEEEQEQTDETSERIDPDRVTVEEAREAGPVHACHQMWLKLNIDRILQDLGFDERACALTEMLVINRLVEPGSELATRKWAPQTSLGDILGKENCELGATTLYKQLDKIHPLRSQIEAALVQEERDIFKLSNSIFLYDLTSTYFEGQCLKNDQALHGYSRDQRPDCKQVVVGLVVSSDRFPIAHEVFDGNKSDTTTLDEMLDILDARAGGSCSGRTIVVDRGMSSKENLATIQDRNCHYIVATRQQERDEYLAEIESDEGWQKLFKVRKGKYYDTVLNEIKIKRLSKELVAAVKAKKLEAAQNRFKRARQAAESAQEAGKHQDFCIEKSLAAVESSRELKNAANEAKLEEHLIVCISKGRSEKDRAIREKQEKKFLADAKALVAAAGSMKTAKVHERIGRLKERYSRVARYYDFLFDEDKGELSITENAERKELAKELDGSYIIRTDRNNLTNQEVWQTYMMLTRVESAFRDMKSPLLERPIFHQLERRVQTHIFVCLLAYHLLALIEKLFRDRGISTSWETIRETLRTHQVVTVVMPCKSSKNVLRLRKGTTPEKQHREIYDVLGIPHEPMAPVKSWSVCGTKTAAVSMATFHTAGTTA
jgi:transposase